MARVRVALAALRSEAQAPTSIAADAVWREVLAQPVVQAYDGEGPNDEREERRVHG